MKLKRVLSSMLAASMVLSMTACGAKSEPAASTTAAATEAATTAAAAEETKAEAPADDPNRPAAVTPEDWEAMKKEPVFGKEINYLFNGGACVSAKYVAEARGYYEEYGINATYLQGGSVVETVGTGQAMWGTDHIATMLVPVTNGVNMTFVVGAHIGCKSIYVPVDSDIKTPADLAGKKIAIHDGIGNSDHNICYRLLDEYGVDPTKEVEFLDIADSAATVAAMQSGEVDASIFSDYFVLANYKDEMRYVCSITFDEAFQDEPCCVTAMNNDFIKENPVHAKYVVKAIKRAGEWSRLNTKDAVQLMYDNDKMTGEFENQHTFWKSLYFGLSDKFTERALREIAEDYLRLGIITKNMTVDEVMDLAWTEVCPDEEIEGLTVGDPVVPEGSTIPVKQEGEEAGAAASADAGSEGHLNSWEASADGQWDRMFAPIEMEGRAIDYADFDLTVTAEEEAAMKAEPAYGKAINYFFGEGCTAGPEVANLLGYYEEAGLKVESFKGSSYVEALGTNQAQLAVGHIATKLVPCTNGVDLTFVGGAHIGCKSLYVLADSEYNTTADLKGTKISVPNGIGASDYNITSLLLDADGINPQKDVELMQVSTDACVASMQNGEISAALLSDTFAYKLVKDGTLKCIRSLLDEDFAGDNCCVISMNATFVKENPVHAKKMVQAVQKAHSWMRDNIDESTQFMLDHNLLSGDYDMNHLLYNSLQFGLEQDFTEKSLRKVVEKYVRLGLITSMDDVDAIMEKAWTPVL